MNEVVKRRLKPGEKPGLGQDLKSERLKFLRIGKITRVDYEFGLIDIEWIDSFGEQVKIPFPSAFSSDRGTIQGMPEEGSVVLCGWLKSTQTLEQPVIIGYIDLNFKNSLEYRLNRNKVTNDLKQVTTTREKIGYNSIRTKRRKIYPGEIQTESTQGAELYLDDDVYLSNKSLNEIEIKSADQSIRLSSRQQYHQTNASRIWNGMITREPVENEELFQPTVLPNGQRIQIVTESNNPYHLGGNAFTEYRIETYEKTSGTLNVTEVNSGYDISALESNITFLMGTLVGNDKSNVQKYSKVLRPQIFGDQFSIEKEVDELECLPEEYNSLAGAFQLKFHKSRTTISIDKQGHLFTNFARSTGQHPLGEGRSWEGNFDGSIKLVIGANIAKRQSIILDTKGGIKEVLGFDSIKQRSKETIAQKCLYTEILDADEDGNAFFVKTNNGNVKYDVTGDYNVDISGNYHITVGGKIQEDVTGTKIENYLNDKNNIYGGNYEEVVLKDKNVKISSRRNVEIFGKSRPNEIPPLVITPSTDVDTLAILLGSRTETYTSGNLNRKLLLGNMTAELTKGDLYNKLIAGDHKTEIIAGNEITDITKGDKEITIGTGNYKVNINLQGDIEIKTKVGTVLIQTVSDKIDIKGLTDITINGAKILNKALNVELGKLSTTMGGVVTGVPGIASHYDFITGLPLVGSTTVKSTI